MMTSMLVHFAMYVINGVVVVLFCMRCCCFLLLLLVSVFTSFSLLGLSMQPLLFMLSVFGFAIVGVRRCIVAPGAVCIICCVVDS